MMFTKIKKHQQSNTYIYYKKTTFNWKQVQLKPANDY